MRIADPPLRTIGKRSLFRYALLPLLAWCLNEAAFNPWFVFAQVPTGVRAKGFRKAYTDPQGPRSTIRGDSFQMLPDGRMLLTGLVIETARGTNGVLTVEVVDGFYDPKSDVAYSTNALSARTSDGRFSIAGQGFRFQMTDSRLSLSNQVHTVIQRPASLATGAAERAVGTKPANSNNSATGVAAHTNQVPAKPNVIDIRSDRFDYASELATYTGNVRAKDNASQLSCGILIAFFDPTGSEIQRIEAEESVTFEQGDRRVAATKAVYSMKDEIVALTGHPTWKVVETEGSSEALLINNRTGEIQAERNVRVKLPPRRMLPMDWFSGPAATNSISGSNRWVNILADNLIYQTTNAVFRGDVRIQGSEGAELRCGVLTNKFAQADGKLISIVAQHGLEFSQGETIVRGERATYDTDREWVEWTGPPSWQLREGQGQSDILYLNPKTRQIHAKGHVSMKLHRSGLEFIDLSGLRAQTNALIRTNQEFVIVAEELFQRSGSSIFLHDVRVSSPQRPDQELICEVLAAFFGGAENQLDELVAEENVQVQQGELQADGGKAVYRIAKGLVELSGHPTIKLRGSTSAGDRILLNRIDNTVRIIGDYRIQVDRTEASRQTGGAKSVKR
ncbi:MAG: hypothetical protein HY735_34960 [Verrucomicrobia bacterium]|nr:hypothetical protein [Verrucomicrobiota bacterium]